MPSQPRSNIRAYVQWKNTSVFAGDEIECAIIFKNIATTTAYDTYANGHNGVQNGQQRETRYTLSIANTTASSTIPSTRTAHTRTPSMSSTAHAPPARGHRPTLSLQLARSNSRGGSGTSLSARTPTIAPVRGHGRSLSILSLSQEPVADRKSPTTISAVRNAAPRGHGRSASLQVTSRSPLQATQSMSALPTRRQSPLYEATTPPSLPEGLGEQLPIRSVRRKQGTTSAGNTPVLGERTFSSPAVARDSIPDFEFPPRKTSLTPVSSPQKALPKPTRAISSMHSAQPVRSISPRPAETWTNSAHSNAISRVLSESSTSGTPRSSGDFYSLSNHSDETLTSDTPSQVPGSDVAPVIVPKPSRSSRRGPQILGPARPETLMVGYARATGSFTLDGSLVNNAPFEDIKRKTVQGGGGVVGVEKPKRSSGVFGAFGWGNFGESIGGLLSGNEMSTMAQMKASAGTKAIPLLSTPQSLLFVDVTLAPGESKSFLYRFPLPKGLPPSHKGRAIRVEYALSLGVQRPDAQAVKYVDVPFRVLGSVSSRGEPLGHDLMSPYMLLRDNGRSQSIAAPTSAHALASAFQETDSAAAEAKDPKKELESFLRYTERLLESSYDENGALLSPTAAMSPTASRKSSMFEHQTTTTKDAIDLALLNANIVSKDADEPEAQSTNRFNIARSGQPVAVLTLLRPAYRLGESVTGILDFTAPPISLNTASPIQSYSVNIELCSAEQVDLLLALRSAASIQRATRRVHASTRENTLFARRIGFSLPISPTATPSFETTGVSLAWSLRIEFTTYRQLRGPGGDDDDGGKEDLLEELNRDERGIALIARERLVAETFEIQVPVRVFGAFGIGGTVGENEVEAYEV